MEKSKAHADQQYGFVLISALIFLIILTLVVLSVANVTSSEEKISRNFRDSDVALSAAEAALRDAELRITGGYQWPFAAQPSPVAFNDLCLDGLCSSLNLPAGGVSMDRLDFFDTNGAGGIQARSIKIGYLTGSPSIKGILESAGNCETSPCVNQDQQPRYIIELVCDVSPSAKPIGGNQCGFVYRITAQAVGRHPNTRVTLQEIFQPSLM